MRNERGNRIPNTDRAEFSQIVRELRLGHGLTQKELGKKVGVRNSAISATERGYYAVTRDLANRISETLAKTDEEKEKMKKWLGRE